jgi:NAD(P)-dependent dehydrogenase (short-subunit alcohol dehydrogenase family)
LTTEDGLLYVGAAMAAETNGPLSGRVALVTGAASGVGRATARGLARAGAAVACADVRDRPREGGFDADAGRSTDDAIRSIDGGQAIHVSADVTDLESMREALATAAATFGRLDIVVNNAGTAAWAPIHEETEEDYDRVMAVNARGAWTGCKAACERFVDQGRGGRIVNIASVGAVIGLPFEPAYCASKGAVVALTRQIALDYAPHRIACNAICPGPRETAMTSVAVNDPEARAVMEAATPWPRLGRPEDVANAVVFLASDAAEWITGAVIPVDGGYSVR